LETVSSLRFLGQQGRWSAYRDKGRASCCWFASRRINGHQYVRALGSSHQLTIAHFEQMAATLQSFVTASWLLSQTALPLMSSGSKEVHL
jgi:hypothetical protein